MKYPAYHKDHKGQLEVYKVQIALFGGPAALIYNEGRTQMHEETSPNNVAALRSFIGDHVEKCYCCGYYDEETEKIVLVDKITDTKYFF